MKFKLSALLSKLDAAEEKFKGRCAMGFQQPKITTPNLTSASIYIVDSLLVDLNHLLDYKAHLFAKVKDQITTLRNELYSSRSMLSDVELQENRELKEREMQLVDLANEAEYVTAYFAVREVPSWYLAFRLSNFIEKHKLIGASLLEIKISSGIRGVRVAESPPKESSSQVPAKSIPMSEEIIEVFKEMKKQIVSELVGGPNRLQIIAIIGMGGLGKTTLARKLYNDSNVLLRFDRRSWCVVSQTYQKRKLLIDILSSVSALNKNEISKMEDHELADRVYKSLKGTRYLLVVDDIWKKEVWDDLKRYFPHDQKGSRILFTSRNKDVALQCSSEPIIHGLPLLSTGECWDLLQKMVFPDSFCPRELQGWGKEIARNCKGLPLAVVGIAAVLANIEQKKSLWKEVATNLSSYVSKEQDILELSYLHLPSHLKPCFLYLGMFKEDEEIPAKRLLTLWVSEGLIPKNEHKISEDVAEDYLLELINRSMIQVTKTRSDNGVKTCIMHDMMRDMCLRLGDKESFVKVIHKKSSMYDQHHRICIDYGSYDFTSRQFGPHIRSLFCDFTDLSPIISTFKRLRVLKLSYNQRVFGETLKFLFQLRHLEIAGKLFDFESHTNLEFLSVGEEWKLETQLKMPKLRHLHVGRFFPLAKLDIQKTNCLQTLSGNIEINDVEDEERLRCLSHLQRLKCDYAILTKKCSLDLISLTQLVSLNICCTWWTDSKAINFPIHIKKLSISRIVLSSELLSSIGKLPRLEILKLRVKIVGRRWIMNDDEFQTLKFLKLDSKNIEEWNISEDHFPVLEKLVLRKCPNLKILPSNLGIMPTLQMIELLDCKKDIRHSAKCIQEEQEGAGNEEFKVIISGAYWDE